MDIKQSIALDRTKTTLLLGVFGVVFGDIATSPLYALRVIFGGMNSLNPSTASVFGVLSLVFWALLIVVGLKYCLLIMRADNKGEGGIMAIMTLVLRGTQDRTLRRKIIVNIGLIGTALFFGDAAITPAISVLSAIEGLRVIAPSLKPLVIPVSLLVLFVLFLLQRRGTTFIARFFSPIMIVWLLCMALLGGLSIAKTPGILYSLNPMYAIRFLLEAKTQSLIILGAVVLVVTGAEALYADMGHFGRSPIRRAWFGLVFPALLLNYLGQGALLMRTPSAASNPFFLLGPDWSQIPMLILATLATIVASQAVISGAFSLAWQAVQLGYLPRLTIRHTSSGKFGQIYIPLVNWLLALAVAGIVIGFGSSTRLASAYGIAVTGTMVVTTFLAFGLLRRMWRKAPFVIAILFVGFLAMDLLFLAANSAKLSQGGWVSLAIAGMFYTILSTWRRGRVLLLRRLHARAKPLETLLSDFEQAEFPRVSGTAIYLTASRFGAPISLQRNVEINKVLHERIIILTVVTKDEPWIPMDERFKIRQFGDGIYRVRVYYGYNQEPNVPDALTQCAKHGLDIDLDDTTFFLARENLVSTPGEGMAQWREKLFIRMAVNAVSAMDFWRIPPARVVELGLMVEL